ncbi:centrosomal protein of 95 kDa-like isoform X2 [Liolophura sinensis]|uniref:centrosomal protein of 95 kDa-like isoform X2 n=1 Tax=Liolophura sinensis TaxID=3198878 RepID=UPI0031595E4A
MISFSGLVQLANSILDQLHISNHISSLNDLTSVVFALIYEGLCGERIPDLIQKPRSHQEEVHNCQLVIDALSMDVLHTSLSHITGEDLAAGDQIAVSNMLEIFSGLMEYILNKIESDISSTDGDPGFEVEEDPDALSSNIIDDILEKELEKSREPQQLSATWPSKPPAGSQTHNRINARERSPGHLKTSSMATVQAPATWATSTGQRLETTDSLIREGELLEKRLREPPVLDGPSSSQRGSADAGTPELTPPQRSMGAAAEFEQVGVRGPSQRIRDPERESAQLGTLAATDNTDRFHHTYTHHLYHHYSDPRTKTGAHGSKKDDTDVITGSKATVPVITEHQHHQRASRLPEDTVFTESTRLTTHSRAQTANLLPGSKDPEPYSRSLTRLHSSDVRSKPPQYDNLKATVEKTVQMSREAVSPERRRMVQENILSDDIRERLNRIQEESSEIKELAASLNLPQPGRRVDRGKSLHQSAGLSNQGAQAESPSRIPRKVSFLVEDDSVTDPSSAETNPQESPIKSSLRQYYEERSRRKPTEFISSQAKSGPLPHKAVLVPRVGRGYSSDGDVGGLSDGLSSPESSPGRTTYSKRYGDLLMEDLGKAPSRTEGPQKKKKTVVNICRKKGSVDALKTTKNYVDKENIKARKKADYLRLLYERELEDFRDDLKEQRAQEKTKTESEYKKKVLSAKPKVTTSKTTGVTARKATSRVGRTKAKQRRRSASASPSVGGRIADTTIEPENNLFTKLYEEFPYLYLSPDTWHELWRQGIQQIERLTRAQQAVQTRKNRGIQQLEEAEDRQKILLNILRKEMSHSQRMREQKLKREQELSVKNKLHEKRMQSARSRKYYNEYQVRSRAKMLKRRTKEEMLFKKLFRDGLDIQKDRIRELRRYAKEQREIQAQERQNDIDSLENYYRDQFEMLAESVTREREEQQLREKAQSRVLEQMKKELRKKMEREIQDFQEQLFRDDDDIYFRQLDADRLKEELRVAKYHVKV